MSRYFRINTESMNTVSAYNYLKNNEIEESSKVEESFFIRSFKQFEPIFEDFEIKLISQESLARFSSFDTEKKRSIYLRVLNYHNFLLSMIGKEIDISNNKRTLKTALKDFGLHTSDEIYNHIDEADVVEVYDKNYTQIYRNINCLKFTSYDALTLSSYEWVELFERDQAVNALLFDEASLLLTEKLSLYESKAEEHLMIEKFSPEEKKMLIKNKYGSTVYDSKGNIEGFICTQSAQVIGDKNNDISVGFLRSH